MHPRMGANGFAAQSARCALRGGKQHYRTMVMVNGMRPGLGPSGSAAVDDGLDLVGHDPQHGGHGGLGRIGVSGGDGIGQGMMQRK